MADKEPIVVNPDFSKWYRAAGINADTELVEKRWLAMDSALKKFTRNDIEVLVRCAFNSKHVPPAEQLINLKISLSAGGDSFDEKNARELEILSGIALAMLFTKGTLLSAVAALTVSSVACDGLRVVNQPMDLIGLAEAALGAQAEVTRRRPDLTKFFKGEQGVFDFEKAVAKVKEDYSVAGVSTAFSIAGEQVKNAISRSDTKALNAMSLLSSYITLQDEELQMLWWLVGERSTDFDCAPSSLGGAQILVLPKELADMTQRLPGPVSIKGLLSRSGLKAQSATTIPAAVNVCDPKWLAKLVEDENPSPVSQPLHSAISRKLETGDENSWIPGWSASVGISGAHAFDALSLSNLFYRERLLILN